MGIRITRRAAPDEEGMRGLLAAEDCPHPRVWSGGPDERFDWHAHGYDKILFCMTGSIAFQDREAMTYRLDPGDRLDIEAATDHAAVAGSDGVTCMESYR